MMLALDRNIANIEIHTGLGSENLEWKQSVEESREYRRSRRAGRKVVEKSTGVEVREDKIIAVVERAL